MADLREALLAAAEEADKMQKENQTRFNNLEQYTSYIEGETERLKKKLQKAAEFAKQFADILTED
jgi:hypothetical protein